MEFNCRAAADFVRPGERRLWAVGEEDADRYLVRLHQDRCCKPSTVQGYAGAIARFCDFMTSRYEGGIHVLTGCAVMWPIDDFNRPVKVNYPSARVPPGRVEVAA
ncbi:hypothetical protein ACIRPX_43640 [Streptomyces sp. NPDC101225]|uniref:hypothetical protein n=1 Tax=Streptomyces sp. NPDC101225 TaxID=3366135 RepID=UPI0038042A74